MDIKASREYRGVAAVSLFPGCMVIAIKTHTARHWRDETCMFYRLTIFHVVFLPVSCR